MSRPDKNVDAPNYDSYLTQTFTYFISESQLIIIPIFLFLFAMSIGIILAFKVFGKGWSDILLISKIKKRRDIVIGKICSITTICSIFGVILFISLFIISTLNNTSGKILFDLKIALLMLPTYIMVLFTFTMICSILFYLIGVAKSVFPIVLFFVIMPGIGITLQALNTDYRMSSKMGDNRPPGFTLLDIDSKSKSLKNITLTPKSYGNLSNFHPFRSNAKFSYVDLFSSLVSTTYPKSIYSSDLVKSNHKFNNRILNSTFENSRKGIDHKTIKILKKDSSKYEEFALLSENYFMPSIVPLVWDMLYSTSDEYGEWFHELELSNPVPSDLLNNNQMINNITKIVTSIKGIEELNWSNFSRLLDLIFSPVKGDIYDSLVKASTKLEEKEKYLSTFYPNNIFKPSEKPMIDWSEVSFQKTVVNDETKFSITYEKNKEVKYIMVPNDKLEIDKYSASSIYPSKELLILLMYSNYVDHQNNGLDKIKTSYNSEGFPIISNINRVMRKINYDNYTLINENPSKNEDSKDKGPKDKGPKDKGPKDKDPKDKVPSKDDVTDIVTTPKKEKIIYYPDYSLLSTEQLNKLNKLNSFEISNSFPPIWYSWFFLTLILIICITTLIGVSNKKELKN
ncbi:MAG: hypothetical protein HRT99_04255 [Mycoplasmatales bacterium]|nr:hypothetical protein [Mycoplasmatales bacterium]